MPLKQGYCCKRTYDDFKSAFAKGNLEEDTIICSRYKSLRDQAWLPSLKAAKNSFFSLFSSEAPSQEAKYNSERLRQMDYLANLLKALDEAEIPAREQLPEETRRQILAEDKYGSYQDQFKRNAFIGACVHILEQVDPLAAKGDGYEPTSELAKLLMSYLQIDYTFTKPDKRDVAEPVGNGMADVEHDKYLTLYRQCCETLELVMYKASNRSSDVKQVEGVLTNSSV